jgi:DNA adenine methylase Dam
MGGLMLNNCFNYIGSKDRLFSVIDKNLDKSKKNFIDVFCGSGVVGTNELNNYDRVVMNDMCWQVIDTLKFFRDNDYSKVIHDIERVIYDYNLSKTNKEGYLKLREDYNADPFLRLVFEPAMFYCLVTHSFNYSIHINSKGKFSVPFGANKSYFNSSLREKLEGFQWELRQNKNKITFKTESFDKLLLDAKKIAKDSMFYLDPPYLSSDDSYSRIYYLGKWDEDKERKLYNCLDEINECGGSFLLSNVIENNGKWNKILDEWSKKYNVLEVSASYESCNYQRKNEGKTKEVLVRNY